MTDPYALWRQSLAWQEDQQLPERQKGDPEDGKYREGLTNPMEHPLGGDAHRLLSGFWRRLGPKTEHDEPIAIYIPDPVDGVESQTVFHVGTADKRYHQQDEKAWHGLVTYGAPKFIAVSKADWLVAMSLDEEKGGGWWPNTNPKRPARKMSREEKLGMDALVPDAGGGNNPPPEEAIADQIKSLAELIDDIPEPPDQAAADRLATNLEKMRLLRKRAEDMRVTEKEPHLLAGREIDAKYKAIDRPGATAYDAGDKRLKAFMRKEQARRDEAARAETAKRIKEAAETAQAERDRIAAEEAAKLASMAPDMAEEEVQALADERAAEAVPAPVVEEVKAARVQAGSSTGRATSLRSLPVAHIDDAGKLAAHLVETKHEGFMEELQKIAQAAARVGMTLPGVTVTKGSK